MERKTERQRDVQMETQRNRDRDRRTERDRHRLTERQGYVNGGREKLRETDVTKKDPRLQ